MNITIIGAGNMGASFVKQLTAAGHRVTIVSRNLEKARALASAYEGAVAASTEDAVDRSDLIILATAYADAVPALKSFGSLDGRVVIDITNPLTADFMGLTVGPHVRSRRDR